MRRTAAFVIPGELNQRTGGYVYDRRMIEGLRALGWDVELVTLDGAFPYPAASALDAADAALAAIRSGVPTVIDSLALGAMPDQVVRHAARLAVVALVHLPLAAGYGLDAVDARRFEHSEGLALRASRCVIVTGRAALPLIARYAIDPARVVVVEPGTDRGRLATGSGHDRLELLTVGTINAGKGHELLLRALASVTSTDWRLTCAGSLTREPAVVQRVRRLVDELALSDRVSLVGDLDHPALEECYRRADLFVLATKQETYGMAVAEALAHGLPVVATATGAIPGLLGEDAGIVVPVDDLRALETALSAVMSDSMRRVRLAAGARHARERLPTWQHASQQFSALLESVITHG